MDITLVKPVGSGSSQATQYTPTARPVEELVAAKSKVDNEKVEVPAVEEKQQVLTEEERYVQVERAARSLDIYVVSDQKFTIYKDAAGQYITRFTSLRDGSVTYIPEPELFRSASNPESLLQIQA